MPECGISGLGYQLCRVIHHTDIKRSKTTDMTTSFLTKKRHRVHTIQKLVWVLCLSTYRKKGNCIQVKFLVDWWYKKGESNQQELILGSTHLRIQSSHLIFTLCAGLHSSVFTCRNFREIFNLHFFTLSKIVCSFSSHLRDHNLQSSQKPG